LADQSASWAALLTSVAAVINAIAWPGVAAWFLFTHRGGVSHLVEIFGAKLSSAKKVKFGQIELEEELEEGVRGAREQASDGPLPKSVPKNQIRAAVELVERIRNNEVSRPKVIETVKRQIYELASEYERTHQDMLSGPLRMRKMNEIAAGMRALALAGLPLQSELSRSESVGRRLAAICIFQVSPTQNYFKWLTDRVKGEKEPFVFYQAAIAILEYVREGIYPDEEEVRSAITDCISVIASFKGGEPDKNTIDVLHEALFLVR
jgi:hypothetical protein